MDQGVFLEQSQTIFCMVWALAKKERLKPPFLIMKVPYNQEYLISVSIKEEAGKRGGLLRLIASFIFKKVFI